MGFNPLEEKGMPIEQQLRNWSDLNVTPYDKESVDPYTRCRVITLNGAEMESMWFSHQFSRHCTDMDVKRQLAMTRRIETQQQKAVNWLIPANESTLERTIGYEQVAVDLTAALAQNEPDAYLRQALEFGLLEDFDHLYRYADLMDMQEGKKAESIVHQLTEVMPGRPTVDEHRHPHDEVRKPMDGKTADIISIMNVMTLVAAEQQTLNFYMNVGNIPENPLARALYLEIAQIEEQHVTHYESLLDASTSWFEREVLHQYNEVYLYHSFMEQEVDLRLRKLWELHLDMELGQLQAACEMLEKYEGRSANEFLPNELPAPIVFRSNKNYIRKVLEEQVHLTANYTEFVPVDSLSADHRYFGYQSTVNNGFVPSQEVIKEIREMKGHEYRLQTEGEHPIPEYREAA